MKVNPSRRSIFVIFVAIGVVVFVSLAVWNYARQEPEVQAEPATLGAPAADPAAVADVAAETQEVAAEDAERMGPAKRIVHVPDTRQEAEGTVELEPGDFTGANAADFATSVIEEGLAGDVRMGSYIRDLTHVCQMWFPADEQDIEVLVGMAMGMVSRSADAGQPVPVEGTPWLRGTGFWSGPAIWLFPSEQQVRTHLLSWQRGCKDVGAIFNDQLRRELELLARDGHVMARYLYAIWIPDDALEEQALENYLQWQMNATEFSYANILSGEPVGFLAFGQSYFEAWFTPQNTRLATLMLFAAHRCGLESVATLQVVQRFTGDEDAQIMLENNMGVPQERFDELVAQLTKDCR